MDKNTRKELISGWKDRHPEMGVVSVRCIVTGEEFYSTSKDTATWFNRHRFELNSKCHRNRRLQELWNLYGESGFAFILVSELNYEKPDDVNANDLKELMELCLMENPQAKKL
ncbi:MAG: GIY-YIG nuclease family protein [Clostridiales bacterium]|nr:GIY-YIG nuclease family protein [Clostridiales bacterium]